MRKNYAFCVLLAFLLWTANTAGAFLPPSYPLHWRIEQSSIVGVVEIVGVRRAQPPLLEVELHKLYKGDYTTKEDSINNRRVFVDLTATTSRFNLLDPTGSSLLAKYPLGSLHFAFLKPAPVGFLEKQRVMTPVNWTFETLLPIRNNLISSIHPTRFRSTHDCLSVIEQLIEVDALPNREQKLTFLKRLESADSAIDNPYLSHAVRSWLLDFERQIEREKQIERKKK